MRKKREARLTKREKQECKRIIYGYLKQIRKFTYAQIESGCTCSNPLKQIKLSATVIGQHVRKEHPELATMHNLWCR